MARKRPPMSVSRASKKASGPAAIRNKRAVIQKVISKMQTAVRSRVVKFLRSNFNATTPNAFAVAKAYLKNFRFEQLKNVYYSDLDVPRIIALYQHIVQRSKSRTLKGGLPPLQQQQQQQQQQRQRQNELPRLAPQRKQQQQQQNNYQRQRQAQQKQMLEQRKQKREQQANGGSRLPDIHGHRKNSPHLPNINAQQARRNHVTNGSTATTTNRKPQENVWAAIMNYDLEVKRKEDQAKAAAQQQALRQYEEVLAKQMAEKKAKETAERYERERAALRIHEDEEKFKEEAEKLKQKQMERILRAHREAAEAEEARLKRIENERQKRERAKLQAREEAAKLQAITQREQEEKDRKRQEQRERVRWC